MTILVKLTDNSVKIVKCKSAEKKTKGAYVRHFGNGQLKKAISLSARHVRALKVVNNETIQVEGLPLKVINRVLREAGIKK